MKRGGHSERRSTRRSRAGVDSISSRTKECRSSGRSLSPDGSSTSLCAASAYTPAHAHTRTHRAAVHCAVDTVTMQSPMQFRAIQVRLALCTSDMVYPSPTHTRPNASRKTPSSRVASDDTYGRRRWGGLQLWMQPSCYTFRS